MAESEIMTAAAQNGLETSVAKLGSALQNLFGWANIGHDYIVDETEDKAAERWTQSTIKWDEYRDKTLGGVIKTALGSIEEAVEGLIDKTNDSQFSITVLSRDLSGLQSKVNTLETNINKSLMVYAETAAKDAVNSVLGTLGSRVDELDWKVDKLTKNGVGGDYSDDIDILTSKIASLSSTVSGYQSSINTLSYNYQELDGILKGRFNSAGQFYSDYDGLSNFMDWLQSRSGLGLIGTVYHIGSLVNGLIRDKVESNNKLDERIKGIDDRLKSIESMSGSSGSLNTTIESINSTISNHTSRINGIVTDLSATNNKVSSLSESVDSLREKLTSVDSAAADAAINKVNERLSGLTTSVNTLTDTVNIIKTDTNDAVGKVSGLTASVGDLTTITQTNKNNISNLVNNVRTNSSDIHSLREKITTVSSDLTDLNDRIGANIAELGPIIDCHSSSIMSLREKMAELITLGSTLSESTNNNLEKIQDITAELEGYDELKKIVSNHTISITNNDSKCTNIDTRVNELAAGVRGELEVHSKNIEALDSSLKDLNEIVSLNSSNIDGIKQDLIDNYLKKEDIPNLPDYEPGVDIEEFNNLKNSVTTNTNAIAEVSDRVDGLSKVVDENHKNTQNSIASTQGMIVSSISGVQHNIEELAKKTDKLTTNCDELNKVTQDHTNKLDGWEETVEGSTIQHKGVIRDLSDFKQHVEDTYAKPEDISSLLNSYSPDVSYKNKWVGVETAGNLVGKTGEEIALERHSYSSVLDQIIFVDYEPIVSEPSADVALKEDWDGGMSIDWYDKEKRIILVKDGSVGPDGGDFYPTNVVDAMISYPKNITLDPHFTNGPILSSDEKQTSVGFCKVQNENGDWDYYKKDDNIYHVPSTLEAGEYRYYIATYFTKGSPAINNNGLTVKEWDENTPIESKDYITIIASKPSYYTTPKGDVENPLQLWGDNMVDTMELLPSCQCIQQFSTPKPLKYLYIWNDLAGGYARVPSKDGVPAYMIGTIDEKGYYKYSYDSDTFGHRGGIKVKIEF